MKFQNYALKKEKEKGVSTNLKEIIITKDGFGNFDYKAEQTLIVPDYMDFDIETFCANNAISYKKYDTKDLLNPKSLISRIEDAPGGYKKVYIDNKKLEKLSENQYNNFAHCKNDYEKYYSDSVNVMLRSGDKIPASSLAIYNLSGNQDLKYYVESFGADNLNKEQLIIGFNQKTDDPDHCIYFALKDMGFDNIPVYVDDETYEAGRILGLF